MRLPSPEEIEGFPIGTVFIAGRGQRKSRCTIVERYSKYNSAGVLISVTYDASHVFLGQVVTDRDIIHTTIKMGFIK